MRLRQAFDEGGCGRRSLHAATRVSQGGHDIPEDTIRRRFGKSLDYLERIYKPIVDDWYVYDSREGEFVLHASWQNT